MNIVYNASAGTGKTYQVTQLYENLVIEEGIDPREILLMTFTDNAAVELRMRVSHRLLKARRAAEAEENDVLTECAINAISRLPSAPIGTIHSFCTRLLREHALEAGLSPGFSTLVGDDRDELLNQICRDELLVKLESDPDFKTFCSGAHIIGAGKSFGSSITETVPNLISQAGSLGISLENTETMLPPPASSTTRIEFEQICNRIKELPKITPAVGIALELIQQSLRETDKVEALVERLNELGTKKFGRGGAKEISDDFWALKKAVEEAVKYRERYPAAKAFARYIQSVAVEFQQRKHAMDAVDFDDQLHMAVKLLRSGQATPAFKHIIVDEVQDTSRIQYDLIKLLWNEATSLVICGDKKQGIYTWRGADPKVMPDLEAGITERRNLQTSYRSKAPILDVVNTLFRSVYGEEEYTPDDHLEPHPDFETADEKPCVEFLAPDEEMEGITKQETVAAEMEAVANRIQLLVHGSHDWKPALRYADGFAPTGEANAYRYSDILILLRRTTHQSALEQALRHANIPYTLGGKGRGLFTRQETRDVSLFLNVVTNPTDIYSLVGFLRSPWVGLSDETIAELAWSDGGFSIENLLESHSKPTDIIGRYRALLGTKLASELVRMLIDETGFDALLAGLPRGTQRLANLRKILDWLRENERGAQTTPAAVARKLAEKIQNPTAVPEAALLDPTQNAVTLMTVHASKGLTKRVVVIPDINFGTKSNSAFAHVFFDEGHIPKFGIKITAPDKSKAESPGFKAANARAREVSDHELNNLFYVAMTRARDLVITSASGGKKPKGWLKQLEPLIDRGDIPAIPYSALHNKTNEPIHRPIPTEEQLTTALQTLVPPPKPPTLQRIPATRLAKELGKEKKMERTKKSEENAAALGSLGHAVLEQLALNDWVGSVSDWLDRLQDELGVGKIEAASLQSRIEHTQTLMRGLTAGMEEVRPEWPFLLLDGDQLIDGTIDLLCRTAERSTIFDYKFTEAPDSTVTDAYRGQMELYCKAARKVFPTDGNPEVILIVISGQGPRQLPLVI